jgi:trigger factor
MKVITEQKEACIVDLHIELPPERFQSEWKEVGAEYRRQANLPGFRKGKAPLAIVEKKYSLDIEKEVTRKLLDAAVRDALEEQKLSPIEPPDVREVKLDIDHSLRFTATVITRPVMELPDYKGFDITVPKPVVGEPEVDQFIEGLRGDLADYEPVEGRPLAMGDFAVLDYEGFIDGRRVAESHPDLQQTYAGRKNFWILLEEERPIPGLAAALLGLAVGENRDCEVTYPQQFGEAKLRGQTVLYKVALHEIRERKLPPIDDAFAGKLKQGSTLSELREEVRARLEANAQENFSRAVRGEVVGQLLASVVFDAPSTMVREESSTILREIIRENQSRGVSEDELRSHQEELLGAAHRSAEEKVKLNFILKAIVAKEGISVSDDELAWRITEMAQHSRMTPQKLVRELRRRGALRDVAEEIALGKALAVIVSHAKVNGEQASVVAPPNTKALVQSTLNTESNDQEHVHGPGCGH